MSPIPELSSALLLPAIVCATALIWEGSRNAHCVVSQGPPVRCRVGSAVSAGEDDGSTKLRFAGLKLRFAGLIE
jgi:hypothetical protein